MKRNKKGMNAGTSMPNREKPLPDKNNQTYLNTILKICLFLIAIAFVLIYAGAYYDNELVSILGLGIGTSGGIIQAKYNTEEDD